MTPTRREVEEALNRITDRCPAIPSPVPLHASILVGDIFLLAACVQEVMEAKHIADHCSVHGINECSDAWDDDPDMPCDREQLFRRPEWARRDDG